MPPQAKSTGQQQQQQQPPQSTDPTRPTGSNGEQKQKGEEHGDTASTYEEAKEKGFFVMQPDPTPNEEYTVKGVSKKKNK